jgi:ribosomal-protein-alanine N-acetyltransferase
MSEVLHTERLILRPFAADDRDEVAGRFFSILSHPRAMRFMPTPPHQTVADTEAWMDAELSGQGAHGWAIHLRDGDPAIGYVNFLGNTRIPGMGYLLHPDYWGRGIAPEACRAVLDYGFDRLALDRVELWIDERNAASQRVAHKLGFRLKGRIAQKYTHESAYHFMLIYGLRATEWQAAPDPPAPTSAQPEAATLFRAEPVLMVHDVAASAAFYRDRLGFHVDFLYGDPADHAAVSRGDWTGSLVTIQLSSVPPERDLTPAGYLYIFMDTRLDELYDDYRARGVDIVSEPADRPWGLREFAIRDLDGHTLVFATHL